MLPEGTSVYPRSDLTPAPRIPTLQPLARLDYCLALMLPVGAEHWIGFTETGKLRPWGNGGVEGTD